MRQWKNYSETGNKKNGEQQHNAVLLFFRFVPLFILTLTGVSTVSQNQKCSGKGRRPAHTPIAEVRQIFPIMGAPYGRVLPMPMWFYSASGSSTYSIKSAGWHPRSLQMTSKLSHDTPLFSLSFWIVDSLSSFSLRSE